MKNKTIFVILLITIFLNYWFPKAGIKLSEIPITISMIAFIGLIIIWLLKYISNRKIKISYLHIIIFMGESYFLFRLVFSLLLGEELSNVVGYLLPTAVYPFIFFIITNEIDTKEKYDKIMKVLVIGFFVLCLYSFAQYILGISTIDIPGLTVNYTDYQENGEYWYLQKSNGVTEENAKIVSTYQNGNLLGVNLIIFFPVIYDYLLKNKKNKLAIISMVFFILTLFLTLSRACWLGIVLFLFFRIILDRENTKKKMVRKMILVLLGIASIVFILKNFPTVSNRILSMDFEDLISMSGRTEGAIEFLNSMFNDGNIFVNLIIGPFSFIKDVGLAYEMTPLAVLKIGGIIGLTLWLWGFVKYLFQMNKKEKIENSYRLALIIWFIVGLIEGAYWLVPTAFNLFAMLGVGYAYKYNLEKSEKGEIR